MLETITQHPYFVWAVLISLIVLALAVRAVFNSGDDEYKHKQE